MSLKPEDGRTLELGVKSAGLASFVSLARLIYILAGGIMLIVVARWLGPSQYGIYTLAIAITGFGTAFGSINIGPYFNKYIPKLISEKRFDRIGIFIGDGIVFLLILTICIMVLGDIFAGPIAQSVFGSQSYTFIVYLSMLGIIGAIVYPILTTILVSLGTGVEIAVSSSSALVIQTAISIALVLLGFGAVGVIEAYVASVFLGTVITLYLIHRHAAMRFVVKGFRQRLGHILRFSLPLTSSGLIFGSISNFLIIYMALLLIPTSVIGQYGIATKASTMFDVAIGSISVVLVPMFATALYNRHGIRKISRLYQNSIYYSFLFTVPLIVYATVLSYDIIVTVFTASYNLAVIYMPMVVFGVFLSLLWNNAFFLLVSLGRVKRLMKFAIIGGFSEFIAVLILGYLFGIIGIIVGGFYIVNIVLIWLYFTELKRLRIVVDFSPSLRVLLSNLVLGAIMIPLVFLPIRPLYVLFIGMALVILVYPVLLVKLKAMRKDDIGVLYKVSREIPLGAVLRAVIRYGERFLANG